MIQTKNDITIKELNKTLRTLEKMLDQYQDVCTDTELLVKCIEKITDKIVKLS